MLKVIITGALLFACSALAFDHKGDTGKHNKGPSLCTTFVVFTFTPRDADNNPIPGCPQSSTTRFTDPITNCPTLTPFPPVGAATAYTRALFDCAQRIGTVTYKDAYVIDIANPGAPTATTFTDFLVTTPKMGLFTASGVVDPQVVVQSAIPLVVTGQTGQFKTKFSDCDLVAQTPSPGTGFIPSNLKGFYAVDLAHNIGYVVVSIQVAFKCRSTY